jgi:hypothetical protein
MKSREDSEQETHENKNIQRNKGEHGGSKSPKEGGNKDANTPMQEAYEDSEMTPSKVGIKDLYLKDIVKR